MLSTALKTEIINFVYHRYSELRIILLGKISSRQDIEGLSQTSHYEQATLSSRRTRLTSRDNQPHETKSNDPDTCTFPQSTIAIEDDILIPNIQHENILNFRKYELPSTRDKLYNKITNNGYSAGGYALPNVKITENKSGITFEPFVIRFNSIPSDFSYYGYAIIGRVAEDVTMSNMKLPDPNRLEVLFREYTGQPRIVYHNDLEINSVRFPMLEIG